MFWTVDILQIKKVLLFSMFYKSEEKKVWTPGLNYKPVWSFDDVSSLEKPPGFKYLIWWYVCFFVCAKKKKRLFEKHPKNWKKKNHN